MGIVWAESGPGSQFPGNSPYLSTVTSSIARMLWDDQFVHIVCYGLLKTDKPFDSFFKLTKASACCPTLYDLSLQMLDLLSWQHTAGLTDESPANEALHLSAAMQYCGFWSVVDNVGQADTDGRDLTVNCASRCFPMGSKGYIIMRERQRHFEVLWWNYRERKWEGWLWSIGWTMFIMVHDFQLLAGG